MTCPASLELLSRGVHSGVAPCTLTEAHADGAHEARFTQSTGDKRHVVFHDGDTYETDDDHQDEAETMAMPRQKPTKSKQDVQAPQDFLDAVVSRFGPIAWDLAATKANSAAGSRFYGPGSSAGEDALAQDWTKLTGTLWLNPEYGNIAPFAAKAAASLAAVQTDPQRRDRHNWRVPMLTPAAISTRWFAEHVHGKALVLALRPRLRFVGHADDFPKDMTLSVYGLRPGMAMWRWK